MKLTRLENGWAEAALAAIFPGAHDARLTGIGSMDVAGFLREILSQVPFEVALGLRLAVWIVALAPFFLMGRFSTIARLGQADREAVVGRLVRSERYALRSLVMMLRAFGALLYAGDDAVRARMLAPMRPQGLVSLSAKNVHAA
jgi:hypothetical protein